MASNQTTVKRRREFIDLGEREKNDIDECDEGQSLSPSPGPSSNPESREMRTRTDLTICNIQNLDTAELIDLTNYIDSKQKMFAIQNFNFNHELITGLVSLGVNLDKQTEYSEVM